MSVEATVRAPSKKVWEVLTDIKQYPKWMSHVESVKPLGSPVAAMGTRFRITAGLGSHQVVSEVEVFAADPEERLAWRHLDDKLDGHEVKMASDGETEFVLDKAGKDTKIRVRNSFVAHGLKAMLGANLFLNHKVKPEIEQALERFKALCE